MAHKNLKNHSPYKARQENNKPPQNSHSRGTHKRPDIIYSIEEANDRLADIFRNHHFEAITHAQRRQLAHFYHLLMLNQEHSNFTRLLKLRDIAIKHFIDSLIIAPWAQFQFPLLDLGTGPGLPGIPLKILYPEEKIFLAEGVQKRVEFLKQVREELNLKNLPIVGRNINRHFVYPVKSVITRAVEDISNTLHNVSSCLQKGGRVYFMKGPGVDPEIKMAAETWKGVYKLKENKVYTLPETPHERRLVIYEKVSWTPLPEEDPEENLLLEELSREERQRWGKI